MKLISPITLQTGLYVNGRWAEPGRGSRLAVNDPATGEQVGQVVAATAQEARVAIEAAHAAFPWLEPARSGPAVGSAPACL